MHILGRNRITEVSDLTKHTKYVLQLKIEGPGIRSGSIPVPDLLRICGAIQDGVNRQATALQGKRSLRRGPIMGVVQQECTLELVGIKKGSTTLPFCLAKPQQPIPELEMMTFGIEAVEQFAATIDALGTNGKGKDVDSGVLDSLTKLGEVFEKNTIDRIYVRVPSHGKHHRSLKTVFDRRVRDRVVKLVKIPSHRLETIEGTLEMADFKPLDHKCRIVPLLGKAVNCTFDADKEAAIEALIRKPVKVVGTAKINPHSGQTDEIHITDVEPIDELLMGAKEFFVSKSLSELAKTQGVKPLENPSVLIGGWPADENIDEFLEKTYKERSA